MNIKTNNIIVKINNVCQAIFQVIYEVSKYVIEEGITGLSKPINLLGLIIGLLIMYVTGLIIWKHEFTAKMHINWERLTNKEKKY